MNTARKETILIVDDVPANLEILSSILAPEYIIMAVKSGRKALEIAQTTPNLDLILLDVVMPDLSGFDTCNLLKSDPRTMNIPVIFVTSQTEVIDEACGFAVGGVDYITKPVSPAIVKARVKTHLALSSATRELISQNQHLQENVHLLEQIEQIARHDLKSPLTIFMGASDFMGHEKNLTPSQLNFLKILDSSALKMLNMIDRSLDLFKMERGQYKVKLIPVDVIPVVSQVCKELESRARAKSIECSIFLNGCIWETGNTCMFESEPILLANIVANLVKNAIEASPEGEKVVISLTVKDSLLIEISNKGVIPAEIKARFLERYVTHGKSKGTGLGGYSARLAARTLGGDIGFVSDQEAGTVITVTIPHQVALPKIKVECVE